MNANEILKKHEDANEMHFHEVDRKWIIEAMEEYVALRQTLVSGRVCFSSDCFYHDKTTDTCVGDYAKCTVKQTHR